MKVGAAGRALWSVRTSRCTLIGVVVVGLFVGTPAWSAGRAAPAEPPQAEQSLLASLESWWESTRSWWFAEPPPPNTPRLLIDGLSRTSEARIGRRVTIRELQEARGGSAETGATGLIIVKRAPPAEGVIHEPVELRGGQQSAVSGQLE
ncbi:MAG: hypothetical protein R3F61_13445 [Myxococcota bacterium]